MMVQNILSNLPNKYFKGLTLKFSCRVPNILEMQKKATKEGSKRALASPRLAIKVRYVRRCAGMNFAKSKSENLKIPFLGQRKKNRGEN